MVDRTHVMVKVKKRLTTRINRDDPEKTSVMVKVKTKNG